jgi:hypothetical protein
MEAHMKIYVTAPSTIPVAAWLGRYATALIAIALVTLVTLGVGVAQSLYSTASRTSALEPSMHVSTTLDQHERHTLAR